MAKYNHFIIGGLLGLLLSMAGLTLLTWQFWTVLVLFSLKPSDSETTISVLLGLFLVMVVIGILTPLTSVVGFIGWVLVNIIFWWKDDFYSLLNGTSAPEDIPKE
jgi:hypothetical protein